MKAQQNFESMMTQYAQSKGFVWNSESTAYKSAEAKFNIYSEQFKSIMGYRFFAENVI